MFPGGPNETPVLPCHLFVRTPRRATVKRWHIPTVLVLIVLALAAGAVVWVANTRGGTDETGRSRDRSQAVAAVEVARVETGSIRDERLFTGTLEASARFVVAAKVGGLVERMPADLGDRVERGSVVAEIDDSELVQAVAQAQAEVAVRQAELARARSDQALAQREFDRSGQLRERGIAAEAALDEVNARLESTKASVQLAVAQVSRAQAALELAEIAARYAFVRAEWSNGAEYGSVSERYQDVGNTVSPGDAMVAVVKLDPLKAVIFVTERDYAGLSIGQRAALFTDAMPDQPFEAVIERIAPVFRESSRQAQIELRVNNPDQVLKPGMFARVRVVVREEPQAIKLPVAALTRRDGGQVVFVLSEDRQTVRMEAVQIGITQGESVQVLSPPLSGEVVILGQQFLNDGSRVRVVDANGSLSQGGSR